MEKTLKLVKVGNSRGIRIPQALIQRYHFGDEVRITETSEGLILHAADEGKLSLDDSLAEMARDREAMAEAELWTCTLGDGLSNETFTDWPR
jgi:antitoxin MazE